MVVALRKSDHNGQPGIMQPPADAAPRPPIPPVTRATRLDDVVVSSAKALPKTVWFRIVTPTPNCQRLTVSETFVRATSKES